MSFVLRFKSNSIKINREQVTFREGNRETKIMKVRMYTFFEELMENEILKYNKNHSRQKFPVKKTPVYFCD